MRRRRPSSPSRTTIKAPPQPARTASPSHPLPAHLAAAPGSRFHLRLEAVVDPKGALGPAVVVAVPVVPEAAATAAVAAVVSARHPHRPAEVRAPVPAVVALLGAEALPDGAALQGVAAQTVGASVARVGVGGAAKNSRRWTSRPTPPRTLQSRQARLWSSGPRRPRISVRN